ncbi:MAG: glutamate--tRNA ligase [Patescibacteria group bacterium]
MADTNSRPVRVRFAPSPTGFLHVGGLRTALYNWFFARKHGGTFVLRVEDTDRTRYVEGATESLCRTFKAVGLLPDEGMMIDDEGKLFEKGDHGPYLQSRNKERHLGYAKELMAKGHAYYCFCSKERLEEMAKQQQALKQPPMYDRHCRSLPREEAEKRVADGEAHVIRLAVPTEGTLVVEDLIRGRMEFPWAQSDDQVIVKSDGFPTYHLAAMADDHDMAISHVIRADEWISSLPKHVFIYQSMGWELPQWAHVPLILNPDRSKLSKRQGDVAVEDYLAKGYLPEAILNFIALLGWNPTADREIFTKEELASLFEIGKVNKAGAIFNTEKLNWLNAHYLKQMTEEEYLQMCRPWLPKEEDDHAFLDRVCLIVRDRLEVPKDLPEMTRFLFAPVSELDPAIIPWKKSTEEEAIERLNVLRTWVTDRAEEGFASVEIIEKDLRQLTTDRGWDNGGTLWPLRVALSGMEKSPSPFELLFALGKARSLARIDTALARLA